MPNWKEHLVLAEIGINTAERAAWTGQAPGDVATRVQAVAGKVRNCGPGTWVQPGARGYCGVNRGSAAGAQGSGNGGLGIGYVEEASVADLVGVKAKQEVEAYVADVVHAENGVVAQLALHADIHLLGDRGAIVR